MKPCIDCGGKTANKTGMCTPCIGIANRLHPEGAKGRIRRLLGKADR